jgi:hypothetical protein
LIKCVKCTKFWTFYWKSRGETNSVWPNKSVMNNRTFFEDNFFETLCKETNLYYFQNQGKYCGVIAPCGSCWNSETSRNTIAQQ